VNSECAWLTHPLPQGGTDLNSTLSRDDRRRPTTRYREMVLTYG
jgi:hypothetical protein